MKIGASIFATDQTIKVTRLAVELEARGFESLWIPEKTHLPTSRRTPWPGGELPEWYKRTSDPLTSLAASAAVTTTLRIATGVCLVPIYDPVILAKAVATLDFLSDGRFEFGVGYGWNHEEFATHGIRLADAPAVMRDKIALMGELWRNDVGQYTGTHAHIEPSWSWPKPVQQPRPPIHIGARASAGVFADIASYGDGWLPIAGYGDVIPHIPKLHRAFEAAGRSPAEAVVSVYHAPADPAVLEQYAAAGVQRAVLSLPALAEDEALRALDAQTAAVAQFMAPFTE